MYIPTPFPRPERRDACFIACSYRKTVTGVSSNAVETSSPSICSPLDAFLVTKARIPDWAYRTPEGRIIHSRVNGSRNSSPQCESTLHFEAVQLHIKFVRPTPFSIMLQLLCGPQVRRKTITERYARTYPRRCNGLARKVLCKKNKRSACCITHLRRKG